MAGLTCGGSGTIVRLLSLNAFEDYSAACESRGTEDAKIHTLLHRSTAAARRIVEDALVELLRHEGIVL